MDEIRNKAHKLIEDCLAIDKPIASCKEMEALNDKYWKIHGKQICKRKLIIHFSDIVDEYKLQCVINPLNSYLVEPHISYNEKLISALVSF